MIEESAIVDDDPKDLVGDRWAMHVNAYGEAREVLSVCLCGGAIRLWEVIRERDC
jgi:hypothetical protein